MFYTFTVLQGDLMNTDCKSQPGCISCEFILTHADLRLIQKCAQEKGLDQKDYSTALRLILREWRF
jgi:hypothetical protein